MRLIDEFESADEQNVGTFNKLFRFTPILTMPDETPIEIHEPAPKDLRWVKVGDEFIRMNLALSNNSKDTPPPIIRKLIKKRNGYILPYKVCTKCKTNLHFENFSKHKNSRGGVRSACKKCRALETQLRAKRKKNELHNIAE